MLVCLARPWPVANSIHCVASVRKRQSGQFASKPELAVLAPRAISKSPESQKVDSANHGAYYPRKATPERLCFRPRAVNALAGDCGNADVAMRRQQALNAARVERVVCVKEQEPLGRRHRGRCVPRWAAPRLVWGDVVIVDHLRSHCLRQGRRNRRIAQRAPIRIVAERSDANGNQWAGDHGAFTQARHPFALVSQPFAFYPPLLGRTCLGQSFGRGI